VPTLEIARLIELLNEVDELLRNPKLRDEVWAVLRAHAAERGLADAGYLIDMVGLAAARLRALLTTVELGR
jgi:hypothetical protein